MIKNTSSRSLSVIILLALGLTSCATPGNNPMNNGSAAESAIQDMSYLVQPGDHLGVIAQRLTGQIDNWQAIAEHNGITDPRTLAAGETITIPAALIKTVNSDNTEVSTASSINETTTAGNTSPPISVTTGHGVSVARGHSQQPDETVAIMVSPVEVNRSFELQPIDTSLPVNSAEHRYDSAAPQIKVSGTYYPKGIYAEPANYARLIRRAAPGTLFPVESEVNGWYKIVTDQGIGYIRQSDSTLVN